MSRKKRVYISGPMRGLAEQESRDAFNNAYARLEAQGYDPVDPWDLHDALPMFNDKEMLEIDLEIVKHCEAIYMLRGWEGSIGANKELDSYDETHPTIRAVLYELEG